MALSIEELASMSSQYQTLNENCATAVKALKGETSTALVFAKRFNELSSFLVTNEAHLLFLSDWPKLVDTLFPGLAQNKQRIEHAATL